MVLLQRGTWGCRAVTTSLDSDWSLSSCPPVTPGKAKLGASP